MLGWTCWPDYTANGYVAHLREHNDESVRHRQGIDSWGMPPMAGLPAGALVKLEPRRRTLTDLALGRRTYHVEAGHLWGELRVCRGTVTHAYWGGYLSGLIFTW